MPRLARDEVAPLIRKSDGWWIIVGDYNPGVPEYGPYATKADAEEDQATVVVRIKAWMKETNREV
jgi:hypothetical protein